MVVVCVCCVCDVARGASVSQCVQIFVSRAGHITDWHFDYMENFTIHDFRRTARTHLAALGIDPHVAERCLNCVFRTKVTDVSGRT